MSWREVLGRLLDIEDLESIRSVEPSLVATWAREGPAWLFFGCLALLAFALVVYTRYQHRGRRATRVVLGGMRGLVLGLLLLMLAEPVLTLQVGRRPRPLLWLLFDGTESMSLEDELPADDVRRLVAAVGDPRASTPDPATAEGGATGDEAAARRPPARIEWVKALLRREGGRWLGDLATRFRLRLFRFDRSDAVRTLDWETDERGIVEPEALERLIGELTTGGEVTALGGAFRDLGRRHGSAHLAGVVVLSDFDQNAGPPLAAAAERLGVPVHVVGVGPTAALDLGVDLRAPLLMKKDERTSVSVALRQTGLDGRTVTVRLEESRLEDAGGDLEEGAARRIEERTVTLDGPTTAVDIPYEPERTGRTRLVATVDAMDGEVVTQNNRSGREVTIRDDFLRLVFVEHEPTWEWRFVKEVFHRDRLVGMRGFRTFLRSAHPRVRESSELFLPTLTPRRSVFFATDVIFLGDLPAAAISRRFCEMTREWISRFGGGLVVIAGPRFGPGELAQTSLADALPVVVDPGERARTDREFELRRTPEASQFDFMQLGADERENERAWRGLGRLSWYQPVTRVHPLATVLAEHPEDTCADGETPQPIIALRRYGRGEVVYVGFNEVWRLRRRWGERYYRQFWGQLIHRLGLSHALGEQKRFVVRTDRQAYRVDDRVIATVEAFDANYRPLTEDDVVGRLLEGEVLLPADPGGGGERTRSVSLTQVRDGLFEARVPALVSGEHRIRVTDPVTDEVSEVAFRVASLSVERRSAVRDTALEEEIANRTGGRRLDLADAVTLPEELTAPAIEESLVKVVPIWNTWLCFVLVVVWLLAEWLIRKLIHLP